jgi:hypothetical protein
MKVRRPHLHCSASEPTSTILSVSPFLLLFADSSLVVRSQRSVGLVGGSPTYDLVEAFQAPGTAARTYQYSPDGRLFALAVPSGCVKL